LHGLAKLHNFRKVLSQRLAKTFSDRVFPCDFSILMPVKVLFFYVRGTRNGLSYL
jgi:hypothetical protein